MQSIRLIIILISPALCSFIKSVCQELFFKPTWDCQFFLREVFGKAHGKFSSQYKRLIKVLQALECFFAHMVTNKYAGILVLKHFHTGRSQIMFG